MFIHIIRKYTLHLHSIADALASMCKVIPNVPGRIYYTKLHIYI